MTWLPPTLAVLLFVWAGFLLWWSRQFRRKPKGLRFPNGIPRTVQYVLPDGYTFDLECSPGEDAVLVKRDREGNVVWSGTVEDLPHPPWGLHAN